MERAMSEDTKGVVGGLLLPEQGRRMRVFGFAFDGESRSWALLLDESYLDIIIAPFW